MSKDRPGAYQPGSCHTVKLAELGERRIWLISKDRPSTCPPRLVSEARTKTKSCLRFVAANFADLESSKRKRGQTTSQLPGPFVVKSGDVLLSHTISRAVPSALVSLTSEFEMGSGVTSPLWSPKNFRIHEIIYYSKARIRLDLASSKIECKASRLISTS